MRGAVAIVVLSTAAVATAQPPAEVPPRYGVRVETVLYPQNTPRDAVATLVALIERKKFAYITANVIDPAMVDARVAQRANGFIPAIEKQLDDLRARQRARPAGVDPLDRVPDDARRFADLAREKAEAFAFNEVVQDVRSHLSEYPEHLTFFRKLAKDGDFTDAGAESVGTVKTDFVKKLLLKKAGTRWVIEDRKPEPNADKPAEGEPKK